MSHSSGPNTGSNSGGGCILKKKLLEVDNQCSCRKVDTKTANLLLNVAQKVATPKNWFETSLNPVFNGFLKVTLFIRAGSKQTNYQFYSKFRKVGQLISFKVKGRIFLCRATYSVLPDRLTQK